jgi:hypothetical protein
MAMTTITLEVPEALAARLTPMRDRLPQLLSTALDLLPLEAPLAMISSSVAQPIFNEMLDCLASGPAPEQIAAFKVSSAAQLRLEELLDKNREEGLTDDEAIELDVFSHINHIMILLKARAQVVLAARWS